MMNQDILEKLLKAFGKAYFKADKSMLEACTSSDFEWHQHSGNIPTGTIIKGATAVCEEISRRKRDWKEVVYEDFETFYAESLIVSKFMVSGINESNMSFRVRAVDLYSVADGKISRKDSYWKQIT